MFDKLWSNWFNDINKYFDDNNIDLDEIIYNPTKDTIQEIKRAINIDVRDIGTYEFCLFKMFINKLVQQPIYKSPISDPAKLLAIEVFSSRANIKKFLDKDNYTDAELLEIKNFINIDNPISIFELLNDIRIEPIEPDEMGDLDYLPMLNITGLLTLDFITDNEINIFKDFNNIFSFINTNFAKIKLPNSYDQFMKLCAQELKENYVLGVKLPDDTALRALSTPIVGENKTLGDLALDIKNTYRTIGAEARKKMRDNLDNYLKQFLN